MRRPGRQARLRAGAGCIALHHPPCARARSVESPNALAFSPGGADLYATNLIPGGVAAFRTTLP